MTLYSCFLFTNRSSTGSTCDALHRKIVLQSCRTALLALTGICDSIDRLTTSVTSFIRKCIANVVPTVKVCCFPNQKPWITNEEYTNLKDRATAHRAIAANPEDMNAHKKYLYDLHRGIKTGKRTKEEQGGILLHRL
jgi:hypothetical protein